MGILHMLFSLALRVLTSTPHDDMQSLSAEELEELKAELVNDVVTKLAGEVGIAASRTCKQADGVLAWRVACMLTCCCMHLMLHRRVKS